ncbi:hypothetical protein DIPPA_07311 [Diplonema papillatum]|nr:hypothetical protein DIPPA_07311 [Diplonema papillatum]
MASVMGYYPSMMQPSRGGKAPPFPAPREYWNMPMPTMMMPYGMAPPQQQQQQPPYPPQYAPQQFRQPRQAPRAAGPRGLKEAYENIIRAPPPHPAKPLARPIPMYLREAREPTITVTVQLPNHATPHTIKLDAADDIRDVKAVIERETGVPGAELRLFGEAGELKDNTESVEKAGLVDGSHLEVQTFNARDGWGVAAVPDEEPEVAPEMPNGRSKEELAEWKELKPGESRVMFGYGEREPSKKAKILMDIYETVMSRPPPGCHPDPRGEKPCLFWAKGQECRAGSSCPYSHAGKRGGGGFFFQRSDPRSKVTCTFFTQGKCLRGELCPFKHPKPASQPSFPPPPGFKGLASQ